MLTKEQVDAALRYNKRASFTAAQVKTIQDMVEAEPVDGVWGPKTVQAVATWQASAGLKPDGKVGHVTYTELQEQLECGSSPTLPPGRVVEIGCGLAAYDQSFPGHTSAEAMETAFAAAVTDGAREIRWWSTEHLIKDIGNKGNSYGEPTLRGLAVPEGIMMGAWVDDPVSAIVKPSYARRISDMQLNAGALMLNRSNTRPGDVPWQPRFEDDELRVIAENFNQHEIDIICTTWPRPSKSLIDTLCEYVAGVLRMTGAVAFEVDTESNWTSKFLEGFPTMKAAAAYLLRRMGDAIRGAGRNVRKEQTTFTYHTENSAKAVLAPGMDLLLPQAYSVRNRENHTVGWNDSLGPGRHQRLAMGRARQAAAA